MDYTRHGQKTAEAIQMIHFTMNRIFNETD